MTDKEYIKRFSSNDQSAFTRFYDIHIDSFVGYFSRKFNKGYDYSLDLFHEAFMTMYDNILCGKLTMDNLTSSLYQYLLGIAIRKMQAGDRKNKEFEKEAIDVQGKDGESTLNAKVKKKVVEQIQLEDSDNRDEELKDFVERAVSDMKPPCNTILKLFYWDKMSWNEIAKVTPYGNADSAKAQKFKCMSKLKPIVTEFRRLMVTS